MKKKFLAIYTGTPESREKKWGSLSAEEQKKRGMEGMKAWGAWAEKLGGGTLDGGNPLGKTKRVDDKGVSDITNSMAAYTIIEAESHQAAAELFLKHPHFTIFPGDGVEIMECLNLADMKGPTS